MQHRIGYLDIVRFVAMLMVMVCHACDPFNAGATYGTGEVDEEMWFWGRVWGSSVRACVPLFVMLTGALGLGSSLAMETFWYRRIKRVLWPFLIWSVIYYMFPWMVMMAGLPESTVYDFFMWASSGSGDLGLCLRRIAGIPFRYDNLASHMWYIYMLIGLYLFIPILGTWVRQATRRQLEMVIGLCIAASFMPYVREYVDRYTFGECEWNEFGLFYYFSGFMGYMLLGHYLVHHVKPQVVPSLLYAVPAFATGAVVCYMGFTHVTSLPDATPEMMELFWYYCSPHVMLMTTALFLAVRLIPVGGLVARALSNFTVCGFGIYIAHYFLVCPVTRCVAACGVPTPVQIPVAGLLILLITWAMVAAVKHFFPRTQWLLG